jgi:hypoxanthine-DNA glycosylase
MLRCTVSERISRHWARHEAIGIALHRMQMLTRYSSEQSCDAAYQLEARMNLAAAGLRGFPPVLNRNVRILILGSFPSAASLAAGQYYAHPRNQFWRLLGAALDEPLADLPYRQRVARVLARGVGIWDVLGACDREGSLDSSIQNERPNDFRRLRHRAPQLQRVLFNGALAGGFARVFAAAGYQTAVLPSSSPAHAGRSFEQKLALWRAALET